MANEYTDLCLRLDWIQQTNVFSVCFHCSQRKAAPLPNTAPLDNWYNVDQEHCIFESMNCLHIYHQTLPYSDRCSMLHRQTQVCTVSYCAELECRIQPSELVGLFHMSSISSLNCFTTSNAAVELFGKYSLIFLTVLCFDVGSFHLFL